MPTYVYYMPRWVDPSHDRLMLLRLFKVMTPITRRILKANLMTENAENGIYYTIGQGSQGPSGRLR